MSQFNDIKVGDKVAETLPFSYNRAPRVKVAIRTVTRVTPTQFVCGTRRYAKKDGYEIGVSGYKSVVPATPEMIAQNLAEQAAVSAHTKAMATLRDFRDALDKGELPIEKMEAMAAAWEATK
jgi:hypothetical protein